VLAQLRQSEKKANMADAVTLEHLDVRTIGPPYDDLGYLSTTFRHPALGLLILAPVLVDSTGPVFGDGIVSRRDHDVTRQHHGRATGPADHSRGSRTRPHCPTGFP